MFVFLIVSAFYFQVPLCMPFSLKGTQPLGFASLQPFTACLWQAYVHPGDGLRPIQGMHLVAAHSTLFE